MKKSKPIDRLMAAMDRCAVARGEANYCDGYRSLYESGRVSDPDPTEMSRLWRQSRELWNAVGCADEAFKRLAQRMLRERYNDGLTIDSKRGQL